MASASTCIDHFDRLFENICTGRYGRLRAVSVSTLFITNAMEGAGVALVAVLLLVLMLPGISVCILQRKAARTSAIDEPQKNESAASFRTGPTKKERSLLKSSHGMSDSYAGAAAGDDRRGSWRCACEGGFLPPHMFGNVESVVRMGSGQCYHKKR